MIGKDLEHRLADLDSISPALLGAVLLRGGARPRAGAIEAFEQP